MCYNRNEHKSTWKIQESITEPHLQNVRVKDGLKCEFE